MTRDDLERLVDVVADGLGNRDAVVAIYPTWYAEPSLRRLQTVRAALDSSYLVLYGSSLPPLAGSVLCGLAAAVGAHVPSPGVLMAGLPLLERQVLPVARLRSVGGLRHPAPSVWQHLASWWPPSSFGVSWWPRPGVRRLRKRDLSVPLPSRSAWKNLALDRVAVAGPKGDALAWVRESVAAPLEVQDVLDVGPTPLATRFWGTSSVVETAAYPGDVQGLVSWVAEGQRAARCRWCGERVVSAECPFCRIDRAVALAGESG